MSEVLLEARGLVRDLGAQVKSRVLHGVDLSVQRGEFLALTGPSGSGKSSLLYLLGVLDRPTAGTVLVRGQDTGDLDDVARARLRNEHLGFVFQFHFLLPEFSVLENVTLPMLKRGRRSPADARRHARRVLEALGLGALEGRPPAQLSGGQQQRVSIARALANEPSVLLADEPTGNLDTVNAAAVVDILKGLVASQGLAIVMVTHEPRFAETASREVRLEDGRIVGDWQRTTSTAVRAST